MPSSYQSPMRKDQAKASSRSQSTDTNLTSHMTRVSDVLAQKDSTIFSISPDETLHRAVELLHEKGIGALTVTNASGALSGILSERDIVRKLAQTPGQTLPQLVQDVMTSTVQTCTADESLVSVLKRMNKGRFRHMPVVDGDTLVGMVSIRDVIGHRLTELEHESLQLKQLIVG